MEADILALSPAMLNLIWIGLFIILLIIEVFTVGLTTIWFAIGALAAAGVNTLGANLIIQVIVFLAVSIVLMIFTRPWAARSIVDGQEWTVRSHKDSEILETGDLAKIVAVSGVKLIVEKYEEGTL